MPPNNRTLQSDLSSTPIDHDRPGTCHGGHGLAHDPETNERFLEESLAWLDSNAARQFARRQLSDHDLPAGGADVDDVINEARAKVWRRSLGDPVQVRRTSAYCATVIANVVRRIVRGDIPYDPLDPTGAAILDGDDESIHAPAAGGSRSPARSLDSIDSLRVRVETSGAAHWTVSGALTFLTATSEADCDLDDVPQPKSHSSNAPYWSALWFAGRRSDCFPGTGKDHARLRKARNRGIEILRTFIDRMKLEEWGQR